jgi:glycosyltransferase involved in cell wall biosynthesis
MKVPLVSIVVPTLNQAQFIEQTLASIVGQNWPALELIVMDGGSTDGTREIVERYPVARFVSERDSGQGDAINKGFRLATGDVLAWLNSDDYYLPLAIARAVTALGDVSKPRLVYGGCLLLFETDNTAKLARPHPYDADELRVHDFIHQPATFWTRALWEQTGELNVDFHYVLDWDFWVRASKFTRLHPLDECLAVYRFHGAHKTGANNRRRTEEILGFIERNGSAEWNAAFNDVANRLPAMSQTWERWGARGHYRLHKLRHLDLYAKHGNKVDVALWQLHV